MNSSRQFVDMPECIEILPRDKRGFPVPKFAMWIDGEPDFRVVAPGWRETCARQNVCWICGGNLGSKKWFVLGPMCTVTRSTSEPPNHKLCAEFAAKNCPFLAMPMAKRNERDMPEEHVAPPGLAINRNPGVAAIWQTTSYRTFKVGDSWLIEVGPPQEVSFWREGRRATRAEVLHSVETGLPLLLASAKEEGTDAVFALGETVGAWWRDILEKYTEGGITENVIGQSQFR
jgi:hypothetical protein